MEDPEPRCVVEAREPLRTARLERRAFPRRAGDGPTAGLLKPRRACEAGHRGWLARTLTWLGLARPHAPSRQAEQTHAARRACLRMIAFRLESILGDLDELGSRRTAIDVCMALERIEAHLADCERTTA